MKDTFYWFGESYKRPLQHDFLSEGVNLYSSTDLFTWHYEGLVFNGTAQMKGMPVEAPFRIERPKVSLNAHLHLQSRSPLPSPPLTQQDFGCASLRCDALSEHLGFC